MSPHSKILSAVLERLRTAEGVLSHFPAENIFACRAAVLLREGNIKAPSLAAIATRGQEALVGSTQTAELKLSVLIAIVTVATDPEPEENVLGSLDRIDVVRRALTQNGGALVLDGVRVTDAVLGFDQTGEPVQVPGANILIQDLVAVFQTRIDFRSGQIK